MSSSCTQYRTSACVHRSICDRRHQTRGPVSSEVLPVRCVLVFSLPLTFMPLRLLFLSFSKPQSIFLLIRFSPRVPCLFFYLHLVPWSSAEGRNLLCAPSVRSEATATREAVFIMLLILFIYLFIYLFISFDSKGEKRKVLLR